METQEKKSRSTRIPRSIRITQEIGALQNEIGAVVDQLHAGMIDMPHSEFDHLVDKLNYLELKLKHKELELMLLKSPMSLTTADRRTCKELRKK